MQKGCFPAGLARGTRGHEPCVSVSPRGWQLSPGELRKPEKGAVGGCLSPPALSKSQVCLSRHVSPVCWLSLALNASLVSCHLSRGPGHDAAVPALSQGLLSLSRDGTGVTRSRPSGTYGVTGEEETES